MLSDLVSSKEEGKKWIYGAITGLILALASYLILYTINPDLTGLSTPNLPTPPSTPPPTNGNGGGGNGGGNGENGPGIVEEDEYNEDDAREILGNAGYTFNANPPQTTVTEIKQNTVSAAIAIATGCAELKGSSCDMIITGGTDVYSSVHESGSNSHRSGHKIDINKPNSSLNAYIFNESGGAVPDGQVGSYDYYNFTIQGPLGEILYVSALNEGNHWDLLVMNEQPSHRPGGWD